MKKHKQMKKALMELVQAKYDIAAGLSADVPEGAQLEGRALAAWHEADGAADAARVALAAVYGDSLAAYKVGEWMAEIGITLEQCYQDAGGGEDGKA